MLEQITSVNYLGVVLGIVTYAIVGSLVYSPILFSKPWQALKGLKKDNTTEMGKAFGTSIIGAAILSFAVALVAVWADVDTLWSGLRLGIVVGLIASGTLFVNSCYGADGELGKRLKIMAIDSFNLFVYLALYGLILGWLAS
jgi:hypothetical protein